MNLSKVLPMQLVPDSFFKFYALLPLTIVILITEVIGAANSD